MRNMDNEEPLSAKPEQPTLRDQFAMFVMGGLLGNSGGPVQRSESSGWCFTNTTVMDLADLSYTVADAMLEARKK